MAGPQRKKKVADIGCRSYRVYSYATKDVAEWIEKKAYQHEVTFASFVYAALKRVMKDKPNFDPKEMLPK